jgi:methionine biosynthesis protein MetW
MRLLEEKSAMLSMFSRIGKIREYLFADFEYIRSFGARLDYEAYWDARSRRDDELDRALYAYKFQLIARLIEPGSTVLDIGCGDGSLLAYLRETRHIEPYGVEISGKACELARQRGIEVLEADVNLDSTALPQADYIIMSEVLEHIPNPEQVLLRVKDRFNTSLLIDIPNTGALNDRFRLLLGRFPKQWVFHAGEHLRFWTVTDFLSLCRQLGYRVERYYGLYDPFYQMGLKLWHLYPRLFARYVLYVLRRQL